MASNEDFIKKNKVVIVDDDKNTKLHYAVALGKTKEIKKIIGTGQKLDPANYLGWTPLMMAVRIGNVEAVELLLQSGADATKKNKFGANVLLVAVTSGSLKIVESILNHLLCGGISRQSLQKVLSPLCVAVLFQQDEIFKYLLQRSFDPNIRTPFTELTPMMFAAAVGNSKALQLLLKFNADPTATNHLGKNVSDIIEIRTKSIDIVDVKKQKPQIPVILINNSQPILNSETTPLQLTPQISTANGLPSFRKSSNIQTPVIITPTISPISPYPCVFFGPNFTPSQFISPSYIANNSILNHAISPSGFISPVFATHGSV